MGLESPEIMLLDGDGPRTAIALLEKISTEIRKNFNKETLRAEIKLNQKPSGPIMLFVLNELKAKRWHAFFSTEDSSCTLNMVAMISPEEKERYLS
jgi:hypothetical protein